MRAYRVPLGEPERGRAKRCLAGTVYLSWLMYESPFKDTPQEERDEMVNAFTTISGAAQWQNAVNYYWHRWVSLTHDKKHERSIGFDVSDAGLVARHIGARGYRLGYNSQYLRQMLNTCAAKRDARLRQD
ncbi:hypothetical protein SARC_03546 [Sphaeroforma arctica JP610]|uniref:Uncharacterized protein n=1 Tax=Sphaeroforma arctica JP610 TaxID=667725 RepID=A0A0L0G5J5_9EUKA|nr:hypothetical protein SARC_03546 [Sphaeroforma arctica JP610]KNC84214.1 hypothetical protein SARC_03546 [Sphaeroforma arctica JP610]|eukprot:XP_014158116.1 hypothetical protein SARC_03546 [Sphaeroforma arctica JP610]